MLILCTLRVIEKHNDSKKSISLLRLFWPRGASATWGPTCSRCYKLTVELTSSAPSGSNTYVHGASPWSEGRSVAFCQNKYSMRWKGPHTPRRPPRSSCRSSYLAQLIGAAREHTSWLAASTLLRKRGEEVRNSWRKVDGTSPISIYTVLI